MRTAHEEMGDRIRIDRAYEKIYLYDPGQGAYVFHVTFDQIGAKRSNRDKTILRLVEEWEGRELYS